MPWRAGRAVAAARVIWITCSTSLLPRLTAISDSQFDWALRALASDPGFKFVNGDVKRASVCRRTPVEDLQARPQTPTFLYFATYILHYLVLVLGHRGRGEAWRWRRNEHRGHAATPGTSASRDRGENVPGTDAQKKQTTHSPVAACGCLQAPAASGPGEA